jgi:hypothetical protein
MTRLPVEGSQLRSYSIRFLIPNVGFPTKMDCTGLVNDAIALQFLAGKSMKGQENILGQ